jgi:hypothetical protein
MKNKVVILVYMIIWSLIGITYGQSDILWEKSYTPDLHVNRVGSVNVEQTFDGGYIIASTVDEEAIWLIKTDVSGDTIWTKIINGGELGGKRIGYGEFLQETKDDGFIFTGQTADDDNLWLIKTNQAGDTLWTKTLFGYNGTTVIQTSEGGYLIGAQNDWSGDDIVLIKTNSFGDTLWTKTYFLNGYTEGNSYIRNIIETNEGEYILSGAINETWGNDQAFLIKTNSSGDTLWTKQFIDGEWWINFVRETSDGGYIIAGAREYGDDKWETWLYKADSSGKKNWEIIIWEGEDGGAELVHELLNGDYICSVNKYKESYPNSDIWIIRINQNGDTLSTKLFLENVDFRRIKFTSDGGFIGLSVVERYTPRLRLIKTAPVITGFENSIKTDLPKIFTLQKNYPNPFNPSTTIEFDLPKASDVRIEVYNIAGQKVQTLLNEKKPAGSHQVEFNADNLSSGVYFYKIEAGEFQDVKKMILIK